MLITKIAINLIHQHNELGYHSTCSKEWYMGYFHCQYHPNCTKVVYLWFILLLGCQTFLLTVPVRTLVTFHGAMTQEEKRLATEIDSWSLTTLAEPFYIMPYWGIWKMANFSQTIQLIQNTFCTEWVIIIICNQRMFDTTITAKIATFLPRKYGTMLLTSQTYHIDTA